MSKPSDQDGHRGHGTTWIITYSNMVTLLMAFFICIITFSSKESESFDVKQDSVVNGAGGKGIARVRDIGRQRDSVVWRLRMRQARRNETGAEMAPIYLDPSEETSTAILRALEGAVPGRLSDDFAIRLSLSVLFESGSRLSASGGRILHALAVNLRDLPYDLRFQVSHADRIPQAVQLCGYLATREGYEPARLAVGGRPPRASDRDSVWLVLARQF